MSTILIFFPNQREVGLGSGGTSPNIWLGGSARDKKNGPNRI